MTTTLTASPAVRATGVRHRFGDTVAIDGVDFDVAAGTVFLFDIPRLLMLDEPTIGLDPIARTSVWERIAEVRANTGMTVLVTTHYMDEADQYCDRVALMHRGRIRAMGTPAELKASVGPHATLDDVFRVITSDELGSGSGGPGRPGEGMRDVRATRRTAHRLG